MWFLAIFQCYSFFLFSYGHSFSWSLFGSVFLSVCLSSVSLQFSAARSATSSDCLFLPYVNIFKRWPFHSFFYPVEKNKKLFHRFLKQVVNLSCYTTSQILVWAWDKAIEVNLLNMLKWILVVIINRQFCLGLFYQQHFCIRSWVASNFLKLIYLER